MKGAAFWHRLRKTASKNVFLNTVQGECIYNEVLSNLISSWEHLYYKLLCTVLFRCEAFFLRLNRIVDNFWLNGITRRGQRRNIGISGKMSPDKGVKGLGGGARSRGRSGWEIIIDRVPPPLLSLFKQVRSSSSTIFWEQSITLSWKACKKRRGRRACLCVPQTCADFWSMYNVHYILYAHSLII